MFNGTKVKKNTELIKDLAYFKKCAYSNYQKNSNFKCQFYTIDLKKTIVNKFLEIKCL